MPILKTTIEIADDLVKTAKAYAAQENITLRALIERGLRLALRSDSQSRRFALRDASVEGRGLKALFNDADWARVRASIYEGRGS